LSNGKIKPWEQCRREATHKENELWRYWAGQNQISGKKMVQKISHALQLKTEKKGIAGSIIK
jgi:hypothetical protein